MARRVNFLDNTDDMTAAMLGMLGFSTNYIVRKTKLTPGQVTYRLGVANIKRGDYRNGDNSVANFVLNSAKHRAVALVKRKIKT
jgi:hypothetical protein